jgi:hypothetical protein
MNIKKIINGMYDFYMYRGKKWGIRGYYLFYKRNFESDVLKIKEGMIRYFIIEADNSNNILGTKFYVTY